MRQYVGCLTFWADVRLFRRHYDLSLGVEHKELLTGGAYWLADDRLAAAAVEATCCLRPLCVARNILQCHQVVDLA
jgi:hypothetical protein